MFDYNSFIVLSPGRTGSKYIVSLIQHSYKQHGVVFTIVNPSDSENATVIEPYKIYHSHDIGILKLKRNKTKVILSIRDLIDSALSQCIQQFGLFSSYHFFPEKDESLFKEIEENIPSFYLNFPVFMSHYNNNKEFYKTLSKENLQDVVVIDYSNIQDIDVMIDILKLKVNKTKLNWLPIKGPGTHNEWIKNWNEIESKIAFLNRNPDLDFTDNSVSREKG